MEATTAKAKQVESTGLIFSIKKILAKKLIVVEEIEDKELIELRRQECNVCPSNIKGECKICGCIIDLKIKSKTNRTKDFGIEVTHCPKGYWGDSDIVELYKNKRK